MIEPRELRQAIRAYQHGDGATINKLQREILDALRELKARRAHEKEKHDPPTRQR